MKWCEVHQEQTETKCPSCDEPCSKQWSASPGGSTPHDPTSDLQCWFGLSYASWLTLPRVFMEAMPDEWQQKMAALLFEYDNAIQNPPDLGTRVQITEKGKLIKTPNWLINYRHPDREKINRVFGR